MSDPLSPDEIQSLRTAAQLSEQEHDTLLAWLRGIDRRIWEPTQAAKGEVASLLRRLDASRGAVPVLCDELERFRAENERLREARELMAEVLDAPWRANLSDRWRNAAKQVLAATARAAAEPSP